MKPNNIKNLEIEGQKQQALMVAQNALTTANIKPWIEVGADQSLPAFAEKLGEAMALNELTNSKIRSIYGEIKRIQISSYEKEKSSFFLLRPKVAYAMGRDPKNKGLNLFKQLFDKASVYVTDSKSYINFCNLIEAILAYHKAYGGKD